MTGYVELFIDRAPDNARRIAATLADFGFADLQLTASDFERPDRVIQFGVAPVRVDLLTSISGVAWEEAGGGRGRGSGGRSRRSMTRNPSRLPCCATASCSISRGNRN